MLQQFYPVAQHSYKYELNKDMNFAAAHFIPFDTAGKCQNVHGHTYFANVTIVGNALQEDGFLVNFQELKQIVHGEYDHTLMNEHQDYKEQSPSTEVVARTIYKNIEQALKKYDNDPKVLQVIVRETPTSYVTYKEPLQDETIDEDIYIDGQYQGTKEHLKREFLEQQNQYNPKQDWSEW